MGFNPLQWFKRAPEAPDGASGAPSASSGYILPPSGFNGSKYPGGFQDSPFKVEDLDYWALRSRSSALFNTNIYARGIVRCLTTNVINVGLHAECIPEEVIIGLPEDSLIDAGWDEQVENRFSLWGDTPAVCDSKGQRSWGEIQQEIYREALIGGDCLVIQRQSPITSLPQLQVVRGDCIQTPPGMEMQENLIDGVELGANGTHVAYHIRTESGAYERIEARGRLTGRLNAWMVYGADKRADEVRGQPLLAICLQALNEVDRYRDSTQRKAMINAMIVGFIEQTQDVPGSLPLQMGAVKKTVEQVEESSSGGKPVNVSEILPGFYMDKLQVGEKPSPYSTGGTDASFGEFEAAMITGCAWGMEIPPEILFKSFNKAFNASQAAINEFKITLNMKRKTFGSQTCDPVFSEWFLASVLLGDIPAQGYLEARNDPTQWQVARAWTKVDWTGAIKPSVDMGKITKAYMDMVDRGWLTNERAARELTGTKWSKNMRRIKKENAIKADSMGASQQPAAPEPVEEPEQLDEEQAIALLKERGIL